MTPEEQLKSGKFVNEPHRLRVNLLYSAAWFSDKMNAFLKKHDITQQQFNVLRILRGQAPEPISTKEIRERMIVTNADTSRLVDRLCAKGLITKQPCPHDGRLVQVFIAEKGKELLGVIDKELYLLDEELSNLSEKEMQVLNQLLNKMRFRV
ncbi:MAG: MarR family transcriptional regulator [Cytophagia bacterium]|nr:MarR family transcriptional regulator [Cytophagia bacterium]